MSHRLWIAVNSILLILLFIYIWFFRPPDSSLVILARSLA